MIWSCIINWPICKEPQTLPLNGTLRKHISKRFCDSVKFRNRTSRDTQAPVFQRNALLIASLRFCFRIHKLQRKHTAVSRAATWWVINTLNHYQFFLPWFVSGFSFFFDKSVSRTFVATLQTHGHGGFVSGKESWRTLDSNLCLRNVLATASSYTFSTAIGKNDATSTRVAAFLRELRSVSSFSDVIAAGLIANWYLALFGCLLKKKRSVFS